MNRKMVGMIGLMLSASPVVAQQPGPVETRAIGSLDTKFVDPACKLDGGGDFRVRSGKIYLKTGIEGTGDMANRTRSLRDGVRVITEAITTAGQTKNPAAWYFLGRLYLQQGDLSGADSAFTRSESLAPGCHGDITQYRYRVWASLVNAGNGFRQAQQADSAMLMFRAANQIYTALPLAFVSLADLENTAGHKDSALYYFGRAAATEPTDTVQQKLRNQALFNHGVLLLNGGQATEAIADFRRYLSIQPNDLTAKKALAQSFRGAGMADSAKAIERELVAAAGAGQAAAGSESLSASDLMEIAVKQFTDKSYAEAAATFGRVITLNPWNRDALYNQGNAYLALEDGPKIAEVAVKLLAIEPLSEYDHSLAAQGYKLAKNQDAFYKMIVAREALLVNVEVEGLTFAGGRATLTGKLTGREGRNEANQVLPPKAQVVVVEFLGQAGTTVTSQEVTIPAMKAGESAPFTAEATGEGITDWRYRLK